MMWVCRGMPLSCPSNAALKGSLEFSDIFVSIRLHRQSAVLAVALIADPTKRNNGDNVFQTSCLPKMCISGDGLPVRRQFRRVIRECAPCTSWHIRTSHHAKQSQVEMKCTVSNRTAVFYPYSKYQRLSMIKSQQPSTPLRSGACPH